MLKLNLLNRSINMWLNPHLSSVVENLPNMHGSEFNPQQFKKKRKRKTGEYFIFITYVPESKFITLSENINGYLVNTD